MYMDVYKHHFDLFVKGVVIYFAAMGAIAGYVFNDTLNSGTRVAVSSVAGIFSLLAVLACLLSRRWVTIVERHVAMMCHQLGLAPFPFSGARHMTIITAILCGFIALGATANILWLSTAAKVVGRPH
jgi:membrane protein implicated in regulation of membrane protease activity